ncbi:translocation/assembly module TamB domain-containing protein [Castellaniella sp.]|uniref:translocation/assembly module TamB domain-containing protein n=1 Tax=Castellaniella sp. TaxID=1955812 RepID=UPI003C724382
MNRLTRLRERLRRGLRIFWLWILPPLVMTLILGVGFAWWCVSSPSGTRWLLRTVVAQFDGQVQGVRGSIRHGLYVEGLALSLPDVDIRVLGLHLKALWPELLDRRLHINDLSAVRVDVTVRPSASPAEAPSEPFRMPALPLGLRVDRLSLGGLGLHLGDTELPVELLSVSTALTLDADTATVALDQLQLAHGDTLLSVNGNLAVRGLAAPWPFELNLQGSAQDRSPQSPVCFKHLLQGPVPTQGTRGASAEAPDGPPCRVDLDVRVAGTLDAFHLQARGQGEGATLQADAEVFPTQAFPLGQTRVALTLPGQAGLEASVQPGQPGADGLRPVQAALSARGLILTPWLPRELGATRLDLSGALQLQLTPGQQVQNLGLTLQIDPASRWNGQALGGHARVARLARAQGPLLDVAGASPLDLPGIRAEGVDVALDLGPDRVRLAGDVSASQTRLSAQALLPALAAVWPGIPGGAELKLNTDGSLDRHRLTVEGHYTPPNSQAGIPGRSPLDARLALEGGWSPENGWQGRLSTLQVRHAGVEARSQGPVDLALGPAGQWRVGRAGLELLLDGQPLLQVQHQASSGEPGQWETRGRIDPLVITPERITQVQAWLGKADSRLGGVRTALSEQARRSRLQLALDWHLKFAGALQGDIHLARTDGDLIVPGDVPIQLGLETAKLDVAIRPTSPAASRAALDLQIDTRDMGRMRLRADTPLHATPGGRLGIRPQDEKHIRLQAESEDLAWVNLLLGGAMEVGGTIHADITGRSLAQGGWVLSGPLQGQDMRLLIADQGVRLLDGTLQAHFDGMRLVLDHLRFPAVRRVAPKEWRTATWVAENPDAQNGQLDVSGQWDLSGDAGQVRIAFSRYPILQRSDRYAMITGDVRIDASLPRIDLSGKIVADAGWFDLDMLNNIPALDSDVVVLKPGEKAPAPEQGAPLDMRADLTIDLGPRFYLTGYGLDSGLVGSLNLHLNQGKLTALGALRTRGGAIDAYGQHLQLRRGTVTFQGDIGNPVLDIQALRTDVAVQAGVQVAGTARRPRIDLVSVPDVSETEKLTWLLLGHGPDDAGGDMSLLFSVGSSFLSGGEPFYKRFGLDELSMRSGELGSTGSILPVESVVSGLDSGASPIEQRFVMASKTLSKDLTVSLEQALAQTGTVARLSYRLMRGLRAEMTAGTVSGLALVYRWFSMD